MTIPYDYHIHTNLSGHSSPDMIVGAIIDRATRLGLRRIVILEHTPEVNRHRDDVVKHKIESFPAPQIDLIAAEVAYWRDHTSLEILVGAEIDADPNRRDGRLLCQPPATADVILASTHYTPNEGGYWYELSGLDDERRRSIYREWLSWTLLIAVNPHVDILAHPGVEMAAIGAIDQFSGSILEDFEKILLACRAGKTAFELNELLTKKMPQEKLTSYIEVVAMARDLGVPISIGSDAHALEKIGSYPWVETVMATLGLKEEHFYHPRARNVPFSP